MEYMVSKSKFKAVNQSLAHWRKFTSPKSTEYPAGLEIQLSYKNSGYLGSERVA